MEFGKSVLETENKTWEITGRELSIHQKIEMLEIYCRHQAQYL
jgi:hypothetical protein